MKRTKFFAGFAALVFTAGLGFVSCSNSDDKDSAETVSTDTSDTDNTEEALKSTAFNLLRTLCSIDGDENDMEELPENWQSADYTIDEGAVIGDDAATVYSLPCYDADDALEYFSDLIGNPVSSDDLTNGTYNWTYSGLGSLTFTKDTTEDDSLFATITFNVPCLANKITKLKFIDNETFAASASENSYKGKPYFGAGDVIKRQEKGGVESLWMCVRPAGGPLQKDKSYWVCLNASGKNLITDKKETITVYNEDDEKVKQTWNFAKNLMSLKTAKAAYHTFAIANESLTENWEGGAYSIEAKNLCGDLSQKAGIELKTFAKSEDEFSFCIAYGSYAKDKKRVTSGRKQNAFTQYVQPFISGLSSIDGERVKEEILTVNPETKMMCSATDNSDSKFAETFKRLTREGFDYTKFLQKLNEFGELETVEDDDLGKIASADAYYLYGEKEKSFIFFSPELCIKDNKGTASEAKNPLGSKYEVVYRSADDDSEWDWWASLSATDRYVDGKLTDFTSENK